MRHSDEFSEESVCVVEAARGTCPGGAAGNPLACCTSCKATVSGTAQVSIARRSTIAGRGGRLEGPSEVDVRSPQAVEVGAKARPRWTYGAPALKVGVKAPPRKALLTGCPETSWRRAEVA